MCLYEQPRVWHRWFSEEEFNEMVYNELDIYYKRFISDLTFVKIEDIIRTANIFKPTCDGIVTIEDKILKMVDSFREMSEKTAFGDVVEDIMFWLANKRYGAEKFYPKRKCLDYKVDRKPGLLWMISNKSSPRWGNSDATSSVLAAFENILAIEPFNYRIVQCIILCAYGTDNSPLKTSKVKHYKLCGRRAWAFLTADPTFMYQVIDAMNEAVADLRAEGRLDDIKTKIHDYVMSKNLRTDDDLIRVHLDRPKRGDHNVFSNLQNMLFMTV